MFLLLGPELYQGIDTQIDGSEDRNIILYSHWAIVAQIKYIKEIQLCGCLATGANIFDNLSSLFAVIISDYFRPQYFLPN